ncbi:MAG: RNA methyltransferase [Erysipelotrichaceae bacterium]|nr:RNA methyltransferase [Erysipelotrichaceae bacterium]
MEITSVHNPRVKAWVKLKEKKHRDSTRKFLVAGEHLIQEALKADLLCELLVCKGSEPITEGVPVYEVTKEILRKLTSLTSSENQIGVCEMPQYQQHMWERIIVLDGVQDPGNLGTIIRNAIAFDYQALLLSNDCADIYNEKVIRATQGALFHLPILRCELMKSLVELKKAQITIYATALRESVPMQSIRPEPKHALIFGNEGTGIKNEILQLCDYRIKIEMAAFESLNVAVASGICMYYFYQSQ